MLTARRKSDHQVVTAYMESKVNGPFSCLQCKEEVILKSGRERLNHFAHANPIACKFAEGESELHRKCKIQIFEELRKTKDVSNAALEQRLGSVRPDVSAIIHGVPVAIEVQISSLSLDTIMRRTIDYAQRGIYVLWLLQWTNKLNEIRYAPKIWERWIHAAYFGQVYYWLEGLNVACYHFDPSFTSVPKTSWYSNGGEKMSGGGYSRKSKRFRTPVRGESINLVKDFVPKKRFWWEGNGLKIPDAKLFMKREDLPFLRDY